jgi:hypothetical protein
MHVANILWPFLLLGALGVAIDFLLGSAGQERVKDWLLRKWDSFEDWHLSNFSEKEAAYFVRLSDRVFGARLLRWQRILACFGIVIASILYWCARAYIYDHGGFTEIFFAYSLKNVLLSFAPQIVIATAFLAISISLTRWISVEVIRRTAGRRAGPVPYIALLGIHLILFFLWRPIVESFRDVLLATIYTINSGAGLVDSVQIALINEINAWGFFLKAERPLASPSLVLALLTNTGLDSVWTRIANASQLLVANFANAIRLLIALGTLLSFIFRKWIARVVSLVWRRILEDKKGAFTLFLGGLGGVAGAIKEIASHF